MPLNISQKTRGEKFHNLQTIYDTIPQTECKKRNFCCQAGCPPLYFIEFINILDYIKKNISIDSLSTIVCQCIDNYFSEEIIKPCPLFNDGCFIYDVRPINCRFYGQIPDEEYKKRQQRVSDEFTMSANEMRVALNLKNVEEVPLYHQCPNVKPIADTGEKVISQNYNKTFLVLEELEVDFLKDMKLEIPFTSYKNFHEHYLWFTIGEDMLEKWTTLKLHFREDPLSKNSVLSLMKKEIKPLTKKIYTP